VTTSLVRHWHRRRERCSLARLDAKSNTSIDSCLALDR
jgi:hypothetical protein